VAVYSGFAYVSDNGNATIRKVDLSNGATTTLAGTAGVAGAADGTGSAAGFYWPNGIVSDGSGNLYVADSGNQKIRKIVAATGAVSTLSAIF
jgi:sugar lactone lactonase YvrE